MSLTRVFLSGRTSANINKTMKCFAALLLILAATLSSHALTVLPGLSFTPATNAPLAGLMTLATDKASRVSVSMSDGKRTWKKDFSDYATNHSETLLGFKPSRTNEITVTVHDVAGNTFTVANPLIFITDPLPTNMPAFRLRTNNVEKMEPGYTLFKVGNRTTDKGYITIVDNSGEVVWYSGILAAFDARRRTNGDLFFPLSDRSAFVEANMLGQTVKSWQAPYRVDPHEDFITEHGSFLCLSKIQGWNINFPTSVTDPHAPWAATNASYYWILEMSEANPPSTSILNIWKYGSKLDPARVNYLTFQVPEEGPDPEHANAVLEDPNDHSIIVSLRNQDAVIKFSRSGQIKWILGPHENWRPDWQRYLLKAVGTPFEWNYGQHAPVITPRGTLLLFDNGNCRSEPYDPPVADDANYSRAAEFSIDEARMQVSQVWQFAGANNDRLYSGQLGNASWLPQTSNVLITFGFVSYENGARPDPIATNATVVRIKEVTHQANPEVVFDLELSDANNTDSHSKGFRVYRSYRIPDLYGNPANPASAR